MHLVVAEKIAKDPLTKCDHAAGQPLLSRAHIDQNIQFGKYCQTTHQQPLPVHTVVGKAKTDGTFFIQLPLLLQQVQPKLILHFRDSTFANAA